MTHMASNNPFRSTFALLGLLTAGATAQSFDWPAVYSGSDTFRHMTCGRLLANYPVQTLAVSRGGKLYLAPDPTSVFALKDATPPGAVVYGLAALEMAAASTDRLAMVQQTGLCVVHDDPADAGLVMVSASNTLSAWSSMRRIAAHRVTAGAMSHVVVGCSDSTDARRVRVATYDGTTLTETASVMTGQTVFDVAIVDFNSDNEPEIAVLAGDGLWVITTGGSVLSHDPIPFQGGRLCSSPNNTAVGAIKVGGVWSLAERFASGQLTVHGALTVPPNVIGVTMGLLSSTSGSGGFPDVVISTDQPFRTIVFGTSSGFDLANPVTIDDSSTLPANPPLNKVPALIRDVDGDGRQDIVLASSAANQLVITNASFLALSATEFDIIDPVGEPEEAWISLWNGETAPASDTYLDIKFDAPTAGQGNHMAILLWKFDPLLLGATNPVMTFTSVETFPLNNGSATTQTKLPGMQGTSWSGNEAFMLEVRRVQLDQNGVPVWVGPATNFMFAVTGKTTSGGDETWADTASRLAGETITEENLPPSSYSVSWSQDPVPSPKQNGTWPGMGNRRVGATVKVKVKVVPIVEVPPAD